MFLNSRTVCKIELSEALTTALEVSEHTNPLPGLASVRAGTEAFLPVLPVFLSFHTRVCFPGVAQ